MRLKVRLYPGFGEGFEEILTINLVVDDGLPRSPRLMMW